MRIEWMDNKMETIHFKTFYFASESQGERLRTAMLGSAALKGAGKVDLQITIGGEWLPKLHLMTQEF